MIIDAIRAAKIGLDRGIGGPLVSASSYFMKSPPEQFNDDLAREKVGPSSAATWSANLLPSPRPVALSLTVPKPPVWPHSDRADRRSGLTMQGGTDPAHRTAEVVGQVVGVELEIAPARSVEHFVAPVVAGLLLARQVVAAVVLNGDPLLPVAEVRGRRIQVLRVIRSCSSGSGSPGAVPGPGRKVSGAESAPGRISSAASALSQCPAASVARRSIASSSGTVAQGSCPSSRPGAAGGAAGHPPPLGPQAAAGGPGPATSWRGGDPDAIPDHDLVVEREHGMADHALAPDRGQDFRLAQMQFPAAAKPGREPQPSRTAAVMCEIQAPGVAADRHGPGRGPRSPSRRAGRAVARTG